MNSSRIWTVGAVVAVLAIGGGAVALGVQPALSTAEAANASTDQAQQVNATTQIELARLSKVAAKQSGLEQQDTELSSAVTGSLRMKTLSRQLRDIAAIDGVKIDSLVPGEAVPYTEPVADGAAAATPMPSSTPTPGATAAPTAAPIAVPGAFGKTDPSITTSNLVVIPITVVVNGTKDAGISFAQDAQHMSRLFDVVTVTFTAGTDAASPPTTTISGNVYALKR